MGTENPEPNNPEDEGKSEEELKKEETQAQKELDKPKEEAKKESPFFKDKKEEKPKEEVAKPQIEQRLDKLERIVFKEVCKVCERKLYTCECEKIYNKK